MQRKRVGLLTKGNGSTIIELPTRHRQTRRAKMTFAVTTGVVGLLAATVASQYTHPIVGLILGLAIGAACGAVLAGLVLAWPVLRVFWHWSPEVGVGLLVVYGWQALMQAANLAVALAVVTIGAAPLAVARVRHTLAGWIWCAVSRHRLRVCFTAFIATNRHGATPLILLAKPTRAGERVWVWLRPGLSIKDLEVEGQIKKLAVACWARDVRVCPASERYAALVRFDITRRDPLMAAIRSPLPELVPADVPVSVSTASIPTGGLDLPDVPDDDEPAPRPRRGRIVATAPGPDHSDYI